MLFGQAIEQMKNGHRVARLAWTSPDQNIYVWCIYFPPIDPLPSERVSERMRRYIPSGPITVNGYFVIVFERKHQRDGEWIPVWQPGWSPTQDDLQAQDWEVLEDVTPGIVAPASPKLEIVR